MIGILTFHTQYNYGSVLQAGHKGTVLLCSSCVAIVLPLCHMRRSWNKMYRTEPLLPYANHCYSIMPKGLPEHFYLQEAVRKYVSEDYVICFDEGVSENLKQRIIKDYAEYHAKEFNK